MEQYLLALATFGCIYGLLGLGLNVTWGLTGLINLGLAGFYGLGAYASALLTTRAGAPVATGFVAAFAIAALGGLVAAYSTRRLRDDYLAIITLGLAEVVRLVALNETSLTGGSDGISGIPRPFPSLTGGEFNLAYLGLAATLLAVAWLVCERLRWSPYGRVLRAIRDDEQAAAAAGKSIFRFKLQAFALGCGLCGLAGALYGHYVSYIAPDNFVPIVAIYVFLALTLGGTGNNSGALLGAFVLVALIESTRFVGDLVPVLSRVQLAASREVLIGVLLLLTMRFRPGGLVPELSTPTASARPTGSPR